MPFKKHHISLLILIIAFLINTNKVIGQESDLNDTISYQNIIVCEKVNSELLFKKITSTIYQIYDSAAITLIENEGAEIQVHMKIYNQLIGKMGHPSGLLFFLYKVEVKDEKFRCVVNNVYYKPMERNRYGRFQEVRTDAELVCKHNFNANSMLFKKIRSQSEEYVNKLSERLKVDAISQVQTNTNSDWY